MARLIKMISLFFALIVTLTNPTLSAPDLTKFTPVLVEEFNDPLNRFDGVTGVWRDFPRREKYIGNGPPSLYVNPTMQRKDGAPLALSPFKVEKGRLSISAAPIPIGTIGDVHDLLKRAGYKSTTAKKVRYYSGSLSTRSSWAQTYGYFEMRARLPEGKGHWPAFWLVPAVDGWPPEIDIFEALGRENNDQAGDNQLHLRVHFDEFTADGRFMPDPNLANPFDVVDGIPQPAIRRERPKGPRYTFSKTVDVGEQFGRDLFEEFNTFALSWTSEEIVWWFGPSSNQLTEVYRSPTPRDVNGPMSVVMNDQIGGIWAGNPDPSLDSVTFQNSFEIDYVKIYALAPTHRVSSGQSELRGAEKDDFMVGTSNNQAFFPGKGFDVLTGGGGKDHFIIHGDAGSKILTDFGPEDVVVLKHWTFDTQEEALSRLVQVGLNVWLIDTQEPEAPQTLIFENISIDDLDLTNFEFGGDEG